MRVERRHLLLSLFEIAVSEQRTPRPAPQRGAVIGPGATRPPERAWQHGRLVFARASPCVILHDMGQSVNYQECDHSVNYLTNSKKHMQRLYRKLQNQGYTSYGNDKSEPLLQNRNFIAVAYMVKHEPLKHQ
jgi:hypothetical protein